MKKRTVCFVGILLLALAGGALVFFCLRPGPEKAAEAAVRQALACTRAQARQWEQLLSDPAAADDAALLEQARADYGAAFAEEGCRALLDARLPGRVAQQVLAAQGDLSVSGVTLTALNTVQGEGRACQYTAVLLLDGTELVCTGTVRVQQQNGRWLAVSFSADWPPEAA